MNGLDLIDQPISIKDYHIYDIDDLPKIFLCIKVKNKLDEERLSIKNIYNPKLVAHFKLSDQLEPMFFYGVEIKPKKQYSKLLELLNNKLDLTADLTYDEFLQTYRSLLGSYGLSCHTCYSYLADGIYPIDVSHVNTISRRDYSNELKTGFDCMLKKQQTPWYLSLHNFNMFVFGRSTGYNSDFTLNTTYNKTV